MFGIYYSILINIYDNLDILFKLSIFSFILVKITPIYQDYHKLNTMILIIGLHNKKVTVLIMTECTVIRKKFKFNT